MKRYDRYFLAIYASSLTIVFALFTTILLIVDVLINLEKIQNFPDVSKGVALFYAFNLPKILYLLYPFLIVSAGMFAVTRLIRSRELRLLEAAGISRRRALMAILIPTLLLGVLGLGIRQWALPELAQEARESQYGAFEFRKGKRITVRDDYGNVWFVRRYNLDLAKLEGARVLSADGTQIVVAEVLIWDSAKGKWLIQGEATSYNFEALTDPDVPDPSPQAVRGELPFGGLYPSDFSRRRRSYSDKPLTELMQNASERPDHYDLQTTLWHELWHPFSGLIILLFGMGIVLSATTQKLYVSGAIVLGGVFGYQIANFWFDTLCQAGAFPAWIGTSITPLFFAGLGGIFYWRA